MVHQSVDWKVEMTADWKVDLLVVWWVEVLAVQRAALKVGWLVGMMASQ